MLYPVWVFIGSVTTIGVILGISVGWIGRAGLRYLVELFHGRSRKSKKSGGKKTKSRSTLTGRSQISERSHKLQIDDYGQNNRTIPLRQGAYEGSRYTTDKQHKFDPIKPPPISTSIASDQKSRTTKNQSPESSPSSNAPLTPKGKPVKPISSSEIRYNTEVSDSRQKNSSKEESREESDDEGREETVKVLGVRQRRRLPRFQE